jgi:outer membrane protein assembly factor BamA
MKKLIILFCLIGVSLMAKERTGWGWGGVPALNYNSDDGAGYGVLLNLFNYKEGGYEPYYFKIKPIIFFTTGGKQDHTFFIDSPYMLGKGWRFNFRIRFKKENYYPFYGFGNDSEFFEEYIETDDDGNSLDPIHGKHYYTFRSTQFKMIANFQKALVMRKDNKPKISLLLGGGFANVDNQLNENEGLETMMEEYLVSGKIGKKEFNGYFNSYLKTGIIYDTRDNEPAPNSGVWSSILMEAYTKLIGSETNFLRMTLTDRRYFPLTQNLVFANRILYEKILGDAPFSMYYPFGGSVKADEGLGGYRSIRGQLKNRYIGPEKIFGNMELRYKFCDFSFLNQDFYLAASTFLDWGRVWHEDDEESGFKNLKFGKGVGIHLGWNENFIVYADLGYGHEVGSQLYVDVGYLF